MDGNAASKEERARVQALSTLVTAEGWILAAIEGYEQANATACGPQGYPAVLRDVRRAINRLQTIN